MPEAGETEEGARGVTSKSLQRAQDVLREERAFEEALRKGRAKADDIADRLRSQEESGAQETINGGTAGGPEDRPDQASKLHRLVEDLRTVLRLLRAYRDREYRSIDKLNVTMLMAAVLYVVNPFDLVPDSLFPAGYLDDAVVVGFAVSLVREEIDRFVTWEQEHGEHK